MRLSASLMIILGAAGVGANEPMLNCNDQVVRYAAPATAQLEKQITVTPLPQPQGSILEERDPEFHPHSPQQTAAFNRVHTADRMKPGPYSNTIDVMSTRGDPIAWRIQIVELRDNARLHWLNEELLFMQLWWGRILSTDLIFELGTGRFIYAKEANYGLLIQPCEEPNPSVKGNGLSQSLRSNASTRAAD